MIAMGQNETWLSLIWASGLLPQVNSITYVGSGSSDCPALRPVPAAEGKFKVEWNAESP